MKVKFNNIEIITIAVYLLGGDSKYIDTEDVAVKANELAPGKFTWHKYPDQINIHNIGKRLCDARNHEKGGYILGSFKQGWRLSENGLKFSRKRTKELEDVTISILAVKTREELWQGREKERMLASMAFEKVKANSPDTVTFQEAETFFRVDDYVTGKTRQIKLDRIIKTFGDDPELGKAVKILAGKVRKK